MPDVAVPSGVQVSYRQQYRRCGKPACARCAAGHGHGPYWYAFWREGGRSRSRYLGRQAPAKVETAPAAVPGAPAPAPSEAAGEALRVRTLGSFAVWRGEEAIPPGRWASRRVAVLFKCLLSAPGHRLGREQAVELLWPEGEPEAGASNLRTTLHLLRQVLDGPGVGSSYLRTEGEVLVLEPGGARSPDDDWLDSTAFARAARAALAGRDAAACRAAVARYGGDYLPEEPYADWAVVPREALRRQYLELLFHLAGLSAAQGELEEAEGCLRRVLAAEPGHEGAAAALMGLLAGSGRRGEALRVYQALATALEQELEVSPGAEVAALRGRLLAQEAAPRAATALPRQDQPKRLTNLPIALTSFVGRAWELAEVREALDGARLVTLTGPGGCGKTRLALAVADPLVEAYRDGVWLVELAALADPALVPRAVATTLGLAEQPGRPALDTLVGFLQPRQVLLVLDNCEHLVEACAGLAAALLQRCPHLRVLATSREGLGVAGERTYLVPSLAVPDPADLPPLERLGGYEAVALFLVRAQARRPELRLTAANARLVATICARLDGLPLAIELAAARVGLLPLEEIVARLDDRFRLLTGGPRTALPRQQTLRATLDWGYGLLGEGERALLRRLSVFVGGWTLAAAEAVCAWGEVDRGELLDLLGGLLNKSLVLAQEAAREIRYSLLETVREYGLEQLAAVGRERELRGRHLAYFLALAEAAEPALGGADQATWLERLERDLDNFRAATHWAAEAGELERGLRLAAALSQFWSARGRPDEGYGILSELLARQRSGQDRDDAAAMGVAATVRARALSGAGALANLAGQFAQATTLLEESVALFRGLGDRSGLAGALASLGAARRFRGEHAQATVFLEESLALYRDLDDRQHLPDALHSLGMVLLSRGDYERAALLMEEGMRLYQALGNVSGYARGLRGLGGVARAQGNLERAIALHEESLSVVRQLGDTLGIAMQLQNLGRLAYLQGDLEHARALYAEGLALRWDKCNPWGVAFYLEGVAGVTAAQRHAARAARLLGAAEALREATHAPQPAYERDFNEQVVALVRASLDQATYAARWAEGRALPVEQAVAAAVEMLQSVRQPE